MSNMTQKDYVNAALEQFADLIIEQMNSMSTSNWQKPWFTDGAMLPPMNIRGTSYTGSNEFMLMIHAQMKEYPLPIFGTFKQFLELNDGKPDEQETICVRKGEKSFPVFHTSVVVINPETKEKITLDEYKRLSADEKKAFRIISHYSVYRVFNVSQTNLQEVNPELYDKIAAKCHMGKRTATADKTDSFTIEAIERMLATASWLCPINLIMQDSAFYSPAKDSITLPLKEQFKDTESFYGTLLHEMAHSTGHESRLNRIKSALSFTEDYAMEELVAELTSAFTLSRYGVTKHIKKDSVSYLKAWTDNLKKDPAVIKNVLADVRKASELIINTIGALTEAVKAA